MPHIFIDESYSQYLNPTDKPRWFILSAMMIQDFELIQLDKFIQKFRDNYLYGNELKYLRGASSENTYITPNVRKKLSLTLYQQLNKNFDIKLVSSIIGKNSIKSNEVIDWYTTGFDLISERIILSYKKDKNPIIMYFDKSNYSTQLKPIIKGIIKNNKGWGGDFNDKIFSEPFFVDDKSVNHMQLSDLFCSGIQNACRMFSQKYPDKNLKGNEDELKNFNEYLSTYWNMFFKSPSGSVKGWGIKIWD